MIASFVSNNNFFQPQAVPCNTASSSLDELGNAPACFLVALLAIASHIPGLLLSLLASQVPKVLSDDYLLPFTALAFTIAVERVKSECICNASDNLA